MCGSVSGREQELCDRAKKLVSRRTSTSSHIEYKKRELFTRKTINSCMSSSHQKITSSVMRATLCICEPNTIERRTLIATVNRMTQVVVKRKKELFLNSFNENQHDLTTHI